MVCSVFLVSKDNLFDVYLNSGMKEILCTYPLVTISYEGVSINNQPIPFPIDRDGHDFTCFVSIYVLYMGTKLHTSSHSLIRY